MATVERTIIERACCDRCGHAWVPRVTMRRPPKVCPKCKSVGWNTGTAPPERPATAAQAAAAVTHFGLALTAAQLLAAGHAPWVGSDGAKSILGHNLDAVTPADCPVCSEAPQVPPPAPTDNSGTGTDCPIQPPKAD